MAEAFTGDPFHEGSSRPMESLKGSCSGVHTQAPMTSTNDGASQGPPDGKAPQTGAWNTTSLGSAPKGTGSNDKNKAH
jgi:hypothetical protein